MKHLRRFVKVLGIDPAPAKKSVVFDGERFLHLSAKELKGYVDLLSTPTLICWDAPLSGAIDDESFSLTIRPIERFFNRNGKYAKEMGIPDGISTLGYASCPHWSISQYIFGYPILNDQFQKGSRFELLMEQKEIDRSRFYITETHPALSMWILLKERLNNHPFVEKSWRYKGGKETLQRCLFFSEEVVKHPVVKRLLRCKVTIQTDDELDAFMCWVLGVLFLKGENAKIYGSKRVGSFLLYEDDTIAQKLAKYKWRRCDV